MAKERDRHAASRRDKRRIRNQARERDEMEKLKEVKFMAQTKPPMPSAWHATQLKNDIIAVVHDKYEDRIAALEAEAASRRAQPDYTARMLAVWAVLLTSAWSALLLWQRFHG